MLPPYMPPPLAAELPLIAPPSCLILEVDHMCFVHLASPMHNPFGFIKCVLDAKHNNPSIVITSSSRGVTLLSLPNRDARWNVTSFGDIEFEGNTLSFEHVEHTGNRAMANFDDLMEIEANDFPHELWHEDGVKYFFVHLGSVCALDQYCIGAGNFVNVCAMVMVTRGMRLPPGMVVLLPGRDLIMVSLTQLAFHAHGIGLDDPSPLSSDDGSDSDSYDFHDAATHETTLASSQIGLEREALLPLGTAPSGPVAPKLAPKKSDIHDNVIRKRVVYSQRVVSASKLHRSACIADRETPFYSTVTQKVSRLKASRFNLAKASDHLVAAVHGSSLCLSEGEASDADDVADKLAHIALVYRANADDADAIHAAGALPSP
ncbi:hypothetical protein D1007_26244 [Hordeum vulgare]|nr:hypothetical protein D1007_26244 [Hordeum vulgare]